MKAMFGAFWGGLRTHLLALLFLIGLVVVAVIVGTGGIYVASESPEFCTSCHYMDPYYRQWQASSHSEVGCVSCHPVRPLTLAVSALRYATNTHDLRPRAEVEDASCLQSGCHEARLLEGKTTFLNGIHFDHTSHLTRLRRGKKLRCTSCHSRLVQGEHIAVTKETCFLCHFRGVGEAQAIGGCTNCHGTPEESVSHEGFVFNHRSYLQAGVACQQCHLQVTTGSGDVPRERCFTCHVERLERYEDSEFMHATHVTEHDVDCFKCHETIQHSEVRMIRALETGCENCHKGLHSPQKEMYLGSGAEGVPDTPSRMFSAQVSCDGCHTRAIHVGTPDFQEESLGAERQSCVACHGKGYDLMLDDWLRHMGRLVRELEPEVAKAESALKAVEAADGAATAERLLVERARHNVDFLTHGRGVHNVEYGLRMAKAAASYVDGAMKGLRKGYQPPERSRLMTNPNATCTDLCHARLGLPTETAFDHLTFPHALHVDEVEVSCVRCHSPEKHKMRIITRTECMDCHHQAEDIVCGHCHPDQQALYTGSLEALESASAEPDIMAQAEVECQGCHDLGSAMSVSAIQEACVACHEPGYGQMLPEWIGEVQEALGPVLVLQEEVRRATGRARELGQGPIAVDRLLEQAASRIRLVESGGGAHNHALCLELLAEAEAQLTEAQALVLGRSPAR